MIRWINTRLNSKGGQKINKATSATYLRQHSHWRRECHGISLAKKKKRNREIQTSRRHHRTQAVDASCLNALYCDSFFFLSLRTALCHLFHIYFYIFSLALLIKMLDASFCNIFHLFLPITSRCHDWTEFFFQLATHWQKKQPLNVYLSQEKLRTKILPTCENSSDEVFFKFIPLLYFLNVHLHRQDFETRAYK